MSGPVKIARARSLRDVLAVDRVIFPDIPPMDTAGRAWWVAREGRRPVAFAGMLVTGATAYLSRAGVVESARGRGLHHELIRVRVSHAEQCGALQVLTYTMRTNVASGNNLIAEGFRLYVPEAPWFDDDSEIVYWRRGL